KQVVDLTDAKITGQIKMIGASFKDVVLAGAKITGPLVDMSGANFDGTLDAGSLQAQQHVSLQDAQCATVKLRDGHVGGNLDLHAAILADFDLSGATVVAQLQLHGDGKSVIWKRKDGEPATLDLRNAHVSSLVDATGAWVDKDSESIKLHLNGFT